MSERPIDHVAISVATYRRPEGLVALLQSLNAMEVPPTIGKVEILIVDNDPQNPCTDDPASLRNLSRFELTYVTEARRGIVNARNRGLDLVPAEADAIAFLDDDETVCPAWLARMVATLDDTGAGAVQGPVRPVYEVPPPPWVEALGFFRLGPYRTGAPLRFASTNNSCVRAAAVRALGLRFDPAFNVTGGEDEDFYQRLLDGGYTIAAVSDAEVFDRVPARRMTPGWHLLRARRMGNTLGRLSRKHGRGRARRFVLGLGQVLLGAGRAATLGLFSKVERMKGLVFAARGAGTLQAFLRVEVREYSAASVARDRRVAE